MLKKISEYTVGGTSVSSIDFTSIPQTYKDLLVFMSLRNDSSSQAYNVYLRFNSSNSNYTTHILQGNSTGIQAQDVGGGMVGDIVTAYEASGIFNNIFVHITDYASTTKAKSYSSDSVFEREGATPAWHMLATSLWNDTSAVTSISITNSEAGKKFVQYSTVTLYGLRNS